jgi:hypothetical protein
LATSSPLTSPSRTKKARTLKSVSLPQKKASCCSWSQKLTLVSFYPSCFCTRGFLTLTPRHLAGCTNQACSFRDNYTTFQSSSFDVYCLSADSSSAQEKWQTKVRQFFIYEKILLMPYSSSNLCHIPCSLTPTGSSLPSWVLVLAGRLPGVTLCLAKAVSCWINRSQ